MIRSASLLFRLRTTFIGVLFLNQLGVACLGQGPVDQLRAGFENPPQSALPRVWWHWTNGNITKEGIRLDIDWMHRAGIGGFHAFEVDMMTPTVVDRPIAFMSPEWKESFREAVSLGNKYGMETAVAGSPGWSEAGGPWVQPKDAMKKIVWSETRLPGGIAFHGKLPQPPATVGPFQNVPAARSAISYNPKFPEYYADSEVIAYRAPTGDVSVDSLHPKITTSSGQIDSSLLSDGDLVKPALLPIAPVRQQSWIQYEFSTPQIIQAISLAMAPPIGAATESSSPTPTLEASDNGTDFRSIAEIGFLKHGYATRGNITETTVAFSPVTARFYRVAWTTPQPKADQGNAFGMSPPRPKPDTNYKIAELVLSPGARVNHFEEKAGFSTTQDLTDMTTPQCSAGSAIPKNDVVILTGRMQPDGTLDCPHTLHGVWKQSASNRIHNRRSEFQRTGWTW